MQFTVKYKQCRNQRYNKAQEQSQGQPLISVPLKMSNQETIYSPAFHVVIVFGSLELAGGLCKLL